MPARSDRAGLVAYFQGVWDELRKVVWPTRDELLRMTGIVIATVVLFGILIGGADYLLSLGVRQVYTSSSTTSAAPTTSGAAVAPTSAPHATPLP
ncbi:MAG: preprotein translocase subunit SecE [Candidatus Dormibacteraeota bacterium]|nr:preprotein translocase subunit SecE [Candidatus Dormibacteraeota bacterium]